MGAWAVVAVWVLMCVFGLGVVGFGADTAGFAGVGFDATGLGATGRGVAGFDVTAVGVAVGVGRAVGAGVTAWRAGGFGLAEGAVRWLCVVALTEVLGVLGGAWVVSVVFWVPAFTDFLASHS